MSIHPSSPSHTAPTAHSKTSTSTRELPKYIRQILRIEAASESTASEPAEPAARRRIGGSVLIEAVVVAFSSARVREDGVRLDDQLEVLFVAALYDR